MFTNGLLIDEALALKLKTIRNFVPIISLEGFEQDTDERRGEGVYERIQGTVAKLKKQGIFWGVSLTVTSINLPHVTDDGSSATSSPWVARLFFLVEYTPVTPETEGWLLSDAQRKTLLSARDAYRKQYPALFVAIPGDEEDIGGCLPPARASCT